MMIWYGSSMSLALVFAALATITCQNGRSLAFTPISPTVTHSRQQSTSLVVLGMGKGLNKARNKQADLRRKMELAKQQKQGANTSKEDDPNATESSKPLTDEEIKERNDRLRFEELLKKEGSLVLDEYSSDGYLSRQQEEEAITAARAGVDRIFEGDPAPTDCFENLIDVKTEKILSKKGAERLVPWLTAGPQEDDYRVIISDPRHQSLELHQVMKDLYAGLPQDIKDRLFFVNADTPAENRRWLKKNAMDDKVQIYCDTEDKDWMKAYTALGDKRWSMTMFIIAQGKVMKIARELDMYNSARTVTNAVKSMKNEVRLF